MKKRLGILALMIVMTLWLPATPGEVSKQNAFSAHAAAACPSSQRTACLAQGDTHFSELCCSCSHYADIFACEDGGGTWNYCVARCQ